MDRPDPRWRVRGSRLCENQACSLPARPLLLELYWRLLREPFGFEKLPERFAYRGTQQSVGATEMMVERGRGDVRDRAYRACRELCGAFPLEDLQGRGHQRFARIHSSTIAMLYRESIALL